MNPAGTTQQITELCGKSTRTCMLCFVEWHASLLLETVDLVTGHSGWHWVCQEMTTVHPQVRDTPLWPQHSHTLHVLHAPPKPWERDRLKQTNTDPTLVPHSMWAPPRWQQPVESVVVSIPQPASLGSLDVGHYHYRHHSPHHYRWRHPSSYTDSSCTWSADTILHIVWLVQTLGWTVVR